MISAILFAVSAGVLVGISRQVNGRLSLSTSPMISSFFNHIVGFTAMCVVALLAGGLFPPTIGDIPRYAYLAGPLGVIFVAASSLVITRIGAVNTAVLIIGGQMIAGAAMDLAAGATTAPVLRFSGLALILVGMLLAQGRRA